MNKFEQTVIWKKTLGEQLESDTWKESREKLRTGFKSFREKATLLAAEIASVFPDFTIHDITHVDALWETADLVLSDDFELNPAEAFVLGGAFLIHDLGMGLAAFPNGKEELIKEDIWKDTVASLFREKYNRLIEKRDLENLDKEIDKNATEKVLRYLHAKHAEKLAFSYWSSKTGENVYMIENEELREAYGRIIGLIAHSHGVSVKELEISIQPNKLGASNNLPQTWTVDAIKLACILRIADAIHIDGRRAPSFLRTIRKPSEYSDLHWTFQQKLNQPSLENDRLVFTSKCSFSINEVNSWWLCYDTLQMIDNELKEVDTLLAYTRRQRLKAIGVNFVEDLTKLSKLITVKDWEPVNAKIKVSNVAKLIGNLGGKQLYGDNLIVPLRELIQNASDAIRARRILENEQPDFGDITVRIGHDKLGQFIEVEDNGIGMSTIVLIGPFIDFGESFWGTTLMHEELPGLESKGFISTGQYGIGFFSVFMWGSKVSVFSNRYGKGRDSTHVLEFNHGISSRPIIRKANNDEMIKNGGTRIRVWLSSPQILDKLLNKKTAQRLIESLCPSMDCNIFLKENNSTPQKIIQANDWMMMPSLELLMRIIGKSSYCKFTESEKKQYEKIAENMRLLKEDDGRIVGRLSLNFVDDSSSFDGLITIGGMSCSSRLNNFKGILIGKSNRAMRDEGTPLVSSLKMKEWASEQANLLSKLQLDTIIEIRNACRVWMLGGDTSNLLIAYHDNRGVKYEELKKIISNSDFNYYLLVTDRGVQKTLFTDQFEQSVDSQHIYKRYNIDLFNNVIIVNDNDLGMDGISILSNLLEEKYGLWNLVIKAFSEAWGEDRNAIIEASDISSYPDKTYKASIGRVNGEDYEYKMLNIIRKPKE